MHSMDVFVRRPVIAIVVNLALVLVGLRAIAELPIQQFPRIESSSIIITTVYVGASAEGIRGFVTTPIERAVSSISGVDYVESTQRRRAQHRHGPPEAEPFEHGRAGRGGQPARPDPERAAGGSGIACRRGPARGPALCDLLRQRDVEDDDAAAAHRLPVARDPAAAQHLAGRPAGRPRRRTSSGDADLAGR